MPIFEIYFDRMPRLRKQMQEVQKKCSRYGAEFTYKEIGETVKTVKDDFGGSYYVRFIVIEAEGHARVNGYDFVASIDAVEPGENIILKVKDADIPQQFYSGPIYCDHCRSKRERKHGVLLAGPNNEWKLVGRSCLKDYTSGYSAEAVALLLGAMETLTDNAGMPEIVESSARCYPISTYLRYVAETVRCYGFVSSNLPEATATRAMEYFLADEGGLNGERLHNAKAEMQKAGFNAKSPYLESFVEDALNWVSTQHESSDYMHNLRTLCTSSKYFTPRYAGIIASLIVCFNRACQKNDRLQKKTDRSRKESEHVGTIGERITVSISDCRLLQQFPTDYGYVRIYRFEDTTGNVFLWKTNVLIAQESRVVSLTGTVHKHDQYQGEKQTRLTRCKVA